MAQKNTEIHRFLVMCAKFALNFLFGNQQKPTFVKTILLITDHDLKCYS